MVHAQEHFVRIYIYINDKLYIYIKVSKRHIIERIDMLWYLFPWLTF